MKIYLVGGAVRDMLLGIKSQDRDYVVVGATPEQMIHEGFSQVGASFPVFLHPTTGEEYALARTERKVGAGYHGFKMDFNPTVTLEEDLRRRDLTINSMALDLENLTLTDPYGGQRDLVSRTLRHTSEAFAEDPVRVLRTARFAARYNFTIAPRTVELMREVAPEIEHVSQERVWKEFEKGLTEQFADVMICALRDCGAMHLPCMKVYSNAARYKLSILPATAPLETRMAGVVRFMPDEIDQCAKLMEKAKIPSHLIKFAIAYNKEHEWISTYHYLTPEQKVALFDRVRAFTDAAFATLLFKSAYQLEEGEDVQDVLLADLQKATSIDAAAIAASVPPKEIKGAIFAARVQALKSV